MFYLEATIETGYFIGMVVVMFILRPTNETCRDTFSYFEEIINEETVTEMDPPANLDNPKGSVVEVELEEMEQEDEEIGKDLKVKPAESDE